MSHERTSPPALMRALVVRERELNALRTQTTELRTWMGRVQEITKVLSRAETLAEARALMLPLLLRNAPYEFAGILCEGELTVHGAELSQAARDALRELAAEAGARGRVEVIELEADERGGGDVRWLLVGPVVTEDGADRSEAPIVLVGRTDRTIGYYPGPWDGELERMGYLLSTIAHVYAAVGYRADLLSERDHLAQQVRVATRELEQALGQARGAAVEAAAASQAKSRFLANMSHELRTPMNGILGAIQLLQTRALPPDQRSLVTMLHDSSAHLLSLLDDILDTARIEAGKLEITAGPLDVPALTAQLVETFRPAASHKGLRLVEQVDPRLARPCQGDVRRIRQVLMNLVGNAIKFTSEGEVCIEAREVRSPGGDRRLRFEVRDTGIGIAPEDVERIFESFTQVDASRTRRFGGSGLGLAICRGLVEALTGELGVSSTLGQGSCFWFEVPMLPARARAVTPTALVEPVARDPQHPMRVLVAEDNPVNQMVVRRMLEHMGCRVHVVGDGLAAVDAAARDDYDLIFMDLEMPRLNGLDATRELRERPRSRKTPIVALTAHAFAEDRDRCFAVGMSDFIAKPIDLGQLQRTLAQHAGPRARS
ncbi:MAG: response regulator [Myxococcales bacterium]|nr:response regulator [Myxococcales bacterium]